MEEKVYRTELTPLSFLERSASIFPDKVAIVHGNREYTYRKFAQRVNRLASHLRMHGLQKHDRVAFLCPNTPALLEAHFAVPAAGGILVAVNTRLNAQEIDFILKHSGVKFLFVDAELSPLVEPLTVEGVQVVRIDDTGSAEDPYEAFLAAGSPEPVTSWLEDEEETIAIPDEKWGERPKAFVILQPGKTATEQEIIAFCRERLAHFKCPVAVEFGDLPKTSTGKVQKFVLREKEWGKREKRIN